MKKLLLALSVLGVAAAAFGQGQIIFQNGSTTMITNTATGLRAASGSMTTLGTTRVGFYINANTAATTTSGGWVQIYTTNLAAAGTFLGGTRDLVSLDGLTTFPAGTPVGVQVRAWLSTAANYTSYESAWANAVGGDCFGVSVVMNITPTATPNTPPNLVNNGLQTFTISPVPEPSSIALGLLGLGAIALFRRKK